MFKKNKTINSGENTERKLYAKTFVKAFGIGFVSGVTNLSVLVPIIVGSAALHRGDLANGEFETTFKTAGQSTVAYGVVNGVVAGVKSTEYLKNVIATLPDDASEIEVEFEKED